jgi:pilus assembly protein CpaE
MRVFLVSDNDLATTRSREVLLREGMDCPARHVLNLGLTADRLAQENPDLIVVILSPDPERAFGVLSQLQLVTHCPKLAVGPTADARLILRALHAGVADYVDEGDLENGLRAAVHRLRGELTAPEEMAKTIAVLGPSGGSGSSTVAVNVATILARERKSTLLLDLKLQTGDLAALLDLKPTHTLADLCQNAARMDRTMLERSLVRHQSGVHLLASPRTFADAALITPEGVRQTLNLARTLFPYLIVDLDHSFAPEQIQVLRQADTILLVFRLDFTCLRNMQRTLDYLDDLGIDKSRVHVVVNRYGQAKEVPAAKAEEALGVKIFHYIPEDSKTINRANNNGVPVVLESPSAKVSRSLARLAGSVNGQHP